MLGSGVHPGLRPVPADYYRYRTPRPAYDYAISERGWRHWSIVDKASVQEIVDVSFEDAPRAVRLLHRLTGPHELRAQERSRHSRTRLSGRVSVRSLAWRGHVPRTGPFAADARRVVIPETEIEGWQDYLSLLWESGPMFLAGTKNHGQAWVPERPTFLEFLKRAPRDGWAGRLLDGSPTRVVPDLSHVAATDWSYMGFARIRWKWRPQPPSVAEIVDAWDRGGIEELMARSLRRWSSRTAARRRSRRETISCRWPWFPDCSRTWTRPSSSRSPPRTRSGSGCSTNRRVCRSSPSCSDGACRTWLKETIAIARRGLVRRGEPTPDAWLAPLLQRIEDGASPAERRIQEVRSGGTGALIRNTRI